MLSKARGDIETYKYHKVSIDTMNMQVNLRLPEKMLVSARSYAKKHGFGTLQEFIKETLREKLFEREDIKGILSAKKCTTITLMINVTASCPKVFQAMLFNLLRRSFKYNSAPAANAI